MSSNTIPFVKPEPCKSRANSLDLESDLQEIATMARIASAAVYEAIGETTFTHNELGFEVADHNDLTSDNVARAMFDVTHVEDMIKDLRKKLGL